jgi:hypothetical protein
MLSTVRVTAQSLSNQFPFTKTRCLRCCYFPWKLTLPFAIPLAIVSKYWFSAFQLWQCIVPDFLQSTYVHCSSRNYNILSNLNVTHRNNTLCLTHIQTLQWRWGQLRVVVNENVCVRLPLNRYQETTPSALVYKALRGNCVPYVTGGPWRIKSMSAAVVHVSPYAWAHGTSDTKHIAAESVVDHKNEVCW